MIVIYVYDGLFKGGLLIMMAEMSAEIGFPISESLTYGFIEAFKHLFIFLINFITAMLVNPLQDEQTRHEQ